MAQAKSLINEFCSKEYGAGSEADFSDLTRVGIAYTTITDEELEVQVEVDLVHFQIRTLVENQVVRFSEYKSLENLIEDGLTGQGFDDLVSVPDRLLDRFLGKDEVPSSNLGSSSKRNPVTATVTGFFLFYDTPSFFSLGVNLG